MDTLFWFRRDLRLEDNAGLYRALKENKSVVPIFIFDTSILEKLPRDDKRVTFIHQEIFRLKTELEKLGTTLQIFYDIPENVFTKIAKNGDIKNVYTNHDYEPYAKVRDEQIKKLLTPSNIELKTYKDQCIFEKGEVLKDDGKPYTVFTPYSRKWKAKFNDFYGKSYPTEAYFDSFKKQSSSELISLEEMNFIPQKDIFPKRKVSQKLVKNYDETRNFPAIDGTSRLSVHLRFGTVSIRHLVQKALKLNPTFLNELIWRDFYMMILWHFPDVEKAFKSKYDFIEWENNEVHFEKWCQGKTGYPMVDAGMRELNATGHMHNRVRMVVASFLCKHLLIDWRWGEAYFAEKLLDFELASNNGGWQWAAGSGCDAAPYFRIFNPESQQKKFDKEVKYIRKWIPEFDNPFEYPQPIVEHKWARERCLERYKSALQEASL